MNTPRLRATLLVALAASAAAQQSGEPSTGLHYFALYNVDRREVEQRGRAGSNGVAHDAITLQPGAQYDEWIMKAATLEIAKASFVAGPNGTRIELPPFDFATTESPDADDDGLHLVGEFIMGTDPDDADSDDDDIPDGAEVRQGLDPLDEMPASTGLIAGAATAGTAVDVIAQDGRAIVAASVAGIDVFNVFSGTDPVLVARVRTPGSARAVASSADLVAVASGTDGLSVVDLSSPPSARVIHQVPLMGDAASVAVAGSLAFVGLIAGQQAGDVVLVDLATGVILDRVSVGADVQDVAVAGDHLFACTSTGLAILTYDAGELDVVGSVVIPFPMGPSVPRSRAHVGAGIARMTHRLGHATIDVSDVGAPRVIALATTSQFGWRQIVPNGSGLALALDNPNTGFDGPNDVSLYDARDPAVLDRFITTFPTPGTALAISLFNALAYIADGDAGLQVLGYRVPDAFGQPPSIALSTSVAGAIVAEGQLMRVTADVVDDVQVRNVEFVIDGRVAGIDGSFPFEHRFITPLLSQQSSLTVQARATDTGGNAAESALLAFSLVAEMSAPVVVTTVPRPGAFFPAGGPLVAIFSEPMALDALVEAHFTVVAAGPDRALATGDDVAVAGVVAGGPDPATVVFTPLAALAPGLHRATTSGLADLAGNAQVPKQWTFFALTGSDSDLDGDGLRDDAEPAFGLDPGNDDTDGDAILDGNEDGDGDGLSNRGEILLGTSPSSADSDGDGVLDGAEDADADGMADGAEVIAGSNPFERDTDGDGHLDGVEFALGSDPLDAASRPRPMIVESHPPGVLRPVTAAPASGSVVSGPGPDLVRPVITNPATGLSTTTGQPPVEVDRP